MSERESKTYDAISLFSGGLDSILAVKVLEAQGLKVKALHFFTPFFGKPAAKKYWSGLYGLDLSGFADLGQVKGWGQFTASGMLNYVHGKNRTTGDNLYNTMPLNARVALTQRLGAWSSTAELLMVTAKTRVSAERNELPTAGYGLLNLRASYEWKQVRLDAGIDNLLDRQYAHPLGGAYVGQGQTMAGTAVPWGVRVPGMGRSLHVGVTVKF